MQVWQRGTSIAMTTSSYTADRWQGYRGVAGSTVSRQATGDTTNLPNIQYCARVQRDSGNTATTTIYFGQSFESANSIPFAGKTVTFSFYARKGADYSQGSSAVAFLLQGGALTDANVITSGGWSTIATLTATLTTTWQRFSVTATVPTTVTQLGTYGSFVPTGTAGANDFFEVTGFQLDIGSVALPFRTNAATIQGELAACQRYYERLITNGQNISLAGFNNSTTVGYATWAYKTSKRTNPTITMGTAATDFAIRIPGGSNAGLTAYSVIGNTLDNAWISGTTTGLTSGNGNLLVNVGSNGYLEASAEL
jgi:hypothetical protein